MKLWLSRSGTPVSHDQDRTGGVSQETFRDATEVETFGPGQVAGSEHEEVGAICFHMVHYGVDDMVHLHVREDGVALFQEIPPQRCDQFGGSLDDRPFQFCDWGFRQVTDGQVGHRAFDRRENGGNGGFRKKAGSKKSGGGSGMFRIINRESHTRQLMDWLLDDKD